MANCLRLRFGGAQEEFALDARYDSRPTRKDAQAPPRRPGDPHRRPYRQHTAAQRKPIRGQRGAFMLSRQCRASASRGELRSLRHAQPRYKVEVCFLLAAAALSRECADGCAKNTLTTACVTHRTVKKGRSPSAASSSICITIVCFRRRKTEIHQFECGP